MVSFQGEYQGEESCHGEVETTETCLNWGMGTCDQGGSVDWEAGSVLDAQGRSIQTEES